MQESKNLGVNYLTKFSVNLNGIGCTIETCWCDELYVLILSCPVNIQGREPYLSDFIIKKKKNPNPKMLVCIQTFKPISFRHSLMIGTTKLYILISVWMTLTFV